MRFLITAGPTREALDPVRFLSNGSTGIMGFACAQAAHQRGHEVILITGPVSLPTPAGVRRVDVVSAADMAQAVRSEFSGCDCVIMTAAVCDYRPKALSPVKLAKTPGDLTLVLERTEDILASLGRQKKEQILIGFAVQDVDSRARAQQKLQNKNLDAIVLNSPASFGCETTDMEILRRGGSWQSFASAAKSQIAAILIEIAEAIHQNKP